MKIVRFVWQDSPRWGILDHEELRLLEGDIYDRFEAGEKIGLLGNFKLLAPAEPRIMVACVMNYRDRIKEEGRLAFRELSLFYKPPNSVAGPDAEVTFPSESRDNRCEAELCVVMKKKARDVTEMDALDYVLGYTCGNDLAAFDFYRKDENLTRVKGFDHSGPLGPYLVTELDTANLAIKCRVNGVLKQDSSTRNMVFNVARLIGHVTAFMTLNPGDVIWTGTPRGGAIPVKPGDRLEVEVEGIGVLRNQVVSSLV